MSVYDDIKSRIDIYDLVSSYNITLKKAGNTYKACCPFHNEDHASFSVNPERQTWRCFGMCAEGGDIFDFVRKIENVDEKESLVILAGRAGVTLAPPKGNKEGAETREKLFGVLSALNDWYRANLAGMAGDACRSYLQGRGITDETIATWGIGYAPGGWRAAYDYLMQLGYKEDILLAAGLIKQNEKGGYYDVFRDRLMIPITAADGKIVSFAGRRMNPQDEPKYLNGGATVVFEKGAILFGLHQARKAILATDRSVVLEGYMDVITAHQEGYTNAVGSMGIAFTPAHASILGKLATVITLCYDPDTAGQEGIIRALPALQAVDTANHFDLFVLPLPDQRDPDELILQDRVTWQRLIDAPIPAIAYVLKVKAGDTSKATFGQRRSIADRLIPIMLGAGTDLQRNENIRLLAEYLRLDPDSLRTVAFKPAKQAPVKPKAVVQECQIEREYLIAMIAKPVTYALTIRHCKALRIGNLKPGDITTPIYRALFTGLLAAWDHWELEDSEYLLENMPESVFELYETLSALPYPFQTESEAIRAGLRLRKDTFERLMQELQGDMDQADLYQQLIGLYRTVSRELQKKVAIS